ncbi:MAG TPA: serine hydrolase domain-containing protein [Gammaproteobacteria bacterium]|nr:serine hydrolase domain-containing protein [Gammaproteobacteria bacterium]
MHANRRSCLRLYIFLLLALASAPAFAVSSLPDSLSSKIDRIATGALKTTGVPSASIAIVRHGRLAYAKAYGNARLNPKTPATPAMRYSIGSISKQFTVTAMLMLAQKDKLSLDDTVSRFFPDLTRAGEITIRELLSHTSGITDLWPQDYVMPFMHSSTTLKDILNTWGKKPLDFAPGSQWQYSNTGYVVAGAIIKKVSGKSPFDFLQKHVFKPLGMTSAYDVNLHALPATDARGYRRYALGPLRPAAKVGVNWVYGGGYLAMTASDLAKWDISMLDQSLLKPASYRQMQTEVRLNNGMGSGYGLGLFIRSMDGHRVLMHDGEVAGFTAENLVFPDDGIAVVVLTNQVAVTTSSLIGRRIADALFAAHDPATIRALTQAREIFSGLQHGKLDRSLFTADANSYFNAMARKDYQSSLGPLGKPADFVQRSAHERGGMMIRHFQVTFPHVTLNVTTDTLPNGKLEQYIVSPAG